MSKIITIPVDSPEPVDKEALDILARVFVSAIFEAEKKRKHLKVVRDAEGRRDTKG